MKVVRVYLEVTPKRTFACTLDWPGWCRSGKTEEAALETLGAYADRYAPVATGQAFPSTFRLEVVERLPGNATTEFGAPGAIATGDDKPLRGKDGARQLALVAAAWKAWDDTVRTSPASLRKGPRGGGRDRDKMAAHVLDAENAYARGVGLKLRGTEAERREALLAALKAWPGDVETKWPARFAARRIAWHVLDHKWEMEDRST